MAVNDNIKFLGKRLGYWTDDFYNDEGQLIFKGVYLTGLAVAVVVPMQGYEEMAGNDILLLEDGKTQPDFVSGEREFDLLTE